MEATQINFRNRIPLFVLVVATILLTPVVCEARVGRRTQAITEHVTAKATAAARKAAKESAKEAVHEVFDEVLDEMWSKVTGLWSKKAKPKKAKPKTGERKREVRECRCCPKPKRYRSRRVLWRRR